MRRVIACFLLWIACSALLHGQNTELEGKAWLDANRAPATLNVTGIWDGGDWGLVALTQRSGDRSIIGTADGWDVTGVVSGDAVFLLFWRKDKVAFSARLAIDNPTQLAGVYAKGILTAQSKTVPITLKK
jgi:hypothetical protein